MIGIGTLLLCQAGSHFGSGYLIPWTFSGIYVGATVAAARLGGMPLVLSMTLFAGLVEIVLSRVIGRFRSYFPTEISGLCVVLVGLSLGVLGTRLLFGVVEGSAAPAPVTMFLLGCGALSVMVAVHVWGGARVRRYSPIIGIVSAYLVALPAGLIDARALAAVAEAPLVALPAWSPRLPSFDPSLAIPFFAVALACCLRVMGDVAVSQKVNDRNWVRPDPRTMSGGALADGAATILAAAAGCVGGTSNASSVGLATATGVTARVVGLWIGGVLIEPPRVCRMLPGLRHAAGGKGSPGSVVVRLGCGWRHVAHRLGEPAVTEPVVPSDVAPSAPSMSRHGPPRQTEAALNRSMVVAARALSSLPPARPSDNAMPAPASLPAQPIATYRWTSTGRRNATLNRLQRCVERRGRCPPFERLAGPAAEGPSDGRDGVDDQGHIAKPSQFAPWEKSGTAPNSPTHAAPRRGLI